MAIIRQNTFESGWANGTPLTNLASGNTGGPAGDYFNSVFASSGNSIQFSETKAHGTQGARLQAGGGGSATVGYDDSDATLSTVYMRGYFRLSAFHTGVMYLMQARGAEGGGTGFSVRVTQTGILQAYQASGGVILGQASKALQTNTWYRIEAKFGRTGAWALRAYVLDQMNPYIPELSGAGATSGMAAGFTFLRWGIEASGLSLTAYLDDVAYGNTWCGPVASPYAAPLDIVSSTWTVGGTASSIIDALGDDLDSSYAESPNLTSSYQSMRVYLSTLGAGDLSVRVRMSGDSTPDARIQLYQGSSKLIATWTVTNVPSMPTDFEFALTTAQAEAVTDRSDLQLVVGGIA